MNWGLVFLGGGFGAACRWLISTQMSGTAGLPWGTLTVNLLGCFLIGYLSVYLIEQPKISLFVLVGFLGGFTTFSSFGLETWQMLRSADYKSLVIYVGLSNVVGLLLVIIGHKIGTLYTS